MGSKNNTKSFRKARGSALFERSDDDEDAGGGEVHPATRSDEGAESAEGEGEGAEGMDEAGSQASGNGRKKSFNNVCIFQCIYSISTVFNTFMHHDLSINFIYITCRNMYVHISICFNIFYCF